MFVVDKKNYPEWANKGAERLYEWLRMRRMDMQDFADLIHVYPRSVPRWLSGRGFPRLPTAIAIEDITKGHVTCHMWGEPPTGEKSRW